MTTREREPRAGLLLALCLLLVACVYARALEGPFIWDDRHLILDSSTLRTSALLDWFRRPFWLGAPGEVDSVAYYRPLTSLSFVLDFAVHGENPTGYHLTSLLLHLGCTAAVFALLRRRGCSPTLTFLLSAGWALLPRLTEAVAWISGRGDVLATLFTMAALLAYHPTRSGRLAVGAMLGLCALLSKESGAAAFVALGVLELGEARSAHRPRWARFCLLGAPLVVYAALRLSAGANALGQGAARPSASSLTLPLEALGRYVFMLVDPWQPRSLLGDLTQVDWAFVALGAASLLGLSWLAWRGRRAEPDAAAAWALALLPLALVLHLKALPVTVVAADRYLYLPAAGLLLAFAPRLQERSRRWPWLPAALMALAIAGGVRTFQRAGDYAEDARFWAEAVQGSPWSSTPYVELGAVAYRAGLFEDGFRLSERGIPLDRLGSGQALDNAALMAMAAGQRERAARLGEQLARAFPRRPAFQLRRAVIALNARDFDTAQRFGEAALRLAPGFAGAERLLRLVKESRSAEQSLVPAAVAQRLDAEAFRYPELEARALREMKEAHPDKPLVAAAVEFMIAKGPPQTARALFQRYQERFGAEGSQAAEAALSERTQRALAVQSHLSALRSELAP